MYASITGYGSSGPWTKRRAYAAVVGAEAGITKAQGDARDSAYANDPFSHADVYTALEAASAILAALYRRERTGEGCWIDVSMAQTMLYVNEHLHDQLYDGDVDSAWIRSFAPGDYPVVCTANGDLVAISGHPAERGTFELFVAAFGLDELASSERFGTVASRLENLAELREQIARAAATVADATALEELVGRHGLAAGKVRTARELAESTWAEARQAIASVSDRRGGTIRLPNPPWRFDDVPERSPGNRASAARTIAACSATCSATTTRRSTSWRRPVSCRAGRRAAETRASRERSNRVRWSSARCSRARCCPARCWPPGTRSRRPAGGRGR